MAEEITTSGAEGAATGAKFGYDVGGPWGAVIGGIIGGIGGLAGGRKKRRRRKKVKALLKAQREMAQYLRRRQIMAEGSAAENSFRGNVAPSGLGNKSSGIQGGLGSIRKQTSTALQVMERDQALQDRLDRAKKKLAKPTPHEYFMAVLGGGGGGGGGGMGSMGSSMSSMFGGMGGGGGAAGGAGGAGGAAGGAGGGAGGAGGGACFLAREVFGETNPEWVAFYRWKESRPLFKKIYDKTAFRAAAIVRSLPILKAPIRKWMRERIKEHSNG